MPAASSPTRPARRPGRRSDAPGAARSRASARAQGGSRRRAPEGGRPSIRPSRSRPCRTRRSAARRPPGPPPPRLPGCPPRSPPPQPPRARRVAVTSDPARARRPAGCRDHRGSGVAEAAEGSPAPPTPPQTRPRRSASCSARTPASSSLDAATRRLPTRRKASPASSGSRARADSLSAQSSRARVAVYDSAPPRSAKPPFRPLAPPPTIRASSTRTRIPADASARAHERPVTPPPTTATSAVSDEASGG